ncbi:hypothetical protein BN14_06257 [Rhizoctonia solani AG-1 IB]|jgi:hypothetical protein|uniref:Uncharacterized protein n=1 Tax=Thanatephorus cucumeris (strain AG1-IB / isolate 7/3/14) TaxID=1108050 RepID=M5BX40_THACB|nr:hypothetical protein BN14_06257 [Rhizoctonia solani AG-1 IB]
MDNSCPLNAMTSDLSAPSEWADTTHTFDYAIDAAYTRDLGLGSTLAARSPQSALLSPTSRQGLTPPYQLGDTSYVGEALQTFSLPKRDARESMTTGQASLFTALLSLAQPGYEMFELGYTGAENDTAFELLPPNPNSEHPLSHTPVYHDQVDFPKYSQGENIINTRLGDTLALDRNVKSNTLPFILQSC